MKNDNLNHSDNAAYLLQFLGRDPSSTELTVFESNQNLMKITKRLLLNDVFHINYTNATDVKLLTDGIMLGGSVQLHSQVEGHRFYSVLFEEEGNEEEHYLILDATIDSAMVNGCRVDLVRGVRLITIEELVRLYSPILYSLA